MGVRWSGEMYKNAIFPREAGFFKTVTRFLRQEVKPLLKGRRCLGGCINFKPVSDGNVTAVPCVGKMPHLQQFQDPFVTVRYERSVGY